jgi:hypothetical protein
MAQARRRRRWIMKELNNEVEIHASAERVWQLLTDFARFPQWTPFIQRASGEPKTGERLEVTTQPSGASRTTSRPTVLKVEPNHELRWIERSRIPGLLDVEHIFTIEQLNGEHVRFTQREIFTGLFAPLPARRRSIDTRRGLREMNQALKTRAEQPRSAD